MVVLGLALCAAPLAVRGQADGEAISCGTYRRIHSITPSAHAFVDDFEQNLSQWEVPGHSFARRVDSGDPSHRMVLELTPNNTAECVLVRRSTGWEKYRVEGEVLFPEHDDSYFGFVYGYRQVAARTDFGCIYIKGNGSYVVVNPHRDGNASRALYGECTVTLPASRKVEAGRWYPFKAEVIGSTCHFYFQDLQTPCITFDDWEYSTGQTGFKPRLLGSACWVDNIHIRPITAFAYQGVSRPENRAYHPQRLLTRWKGLGPFNQPIPEVESVTEADACDIVYQGSHRRFSDFATDSRGCLLTGRICRYSTDEKFAYFITRHTSAMDTDAWLEVSSTDEIGVWVNAVFIGNVPQQESAWYDFSINPEHKGSALKIPLRAGANAILFRVKGGNYSGDGLYARITPPGDDQDPYYPRTPALITTVP
jgi:hypothetical protein